MKKPKFLTRLDHILETTSSRLGLRKKMKQYHLWHQWESIVGPTLAANTEPSSWRGSLLVIKTKNSSWLQELSFMKAELLSKIQAASPQYPIRDIRFEIGTISTGHSPIQKTATLTAEEKEFIDQVTSELVDTELREAAKRAMEKGFARKKG